MAISEYIPVATFLGGVPLIGSATALLSAKVAEKFGHSFTQMGFESSLFVALIGVVQNVTAIALAILIEDKDETKRSTSKKFFIAHLIAGALLFGVTTLAARVNLIASGLSVTGTALLIVTGFAGTMLGLKGAELAEKYADN